MIKSNKLKLAIIVGLFTSIMTNAADTNRKPVSKYEKPTLSKKIILNKGVTIVTDGGFEAGVGSGAWTEASSNFGTPICDTGACGSGTSANPIHSGSFWVWFGGIAANEVGSVSQNVSLTGNEYLHFWLNIPVACDSAADFMSVEVNAVEVFRVDGTDVACATDTYVKHDIDLTGFGAGTFLLEFKSEIFGANGNGTNFFLDDVSINTNVPVELMNYSVE